MEDYDLQSILKQLAQLEKRVHDLETIINVPQKENRDERASSPQNKNFQSSKSMSRDFLILSSQVNTMYQKVPYVTSAVDMTL